VEEEKAKTAALLTEIAALRERMVVVEVCCHSSCSCTRGVL
jgi:hypothetical protein